MSDAKWKFLEKCLWFLSVAIPVFFLFWLSRVFRFREFSDYYFAISIWLSIPFLVLALLCRQRKADGTHRHLFGSLVGATIGAINSVLIPNVVLWDDIAHSHAVGASIGLGVVFLLMPLYLTLLMLLGWFLGSGFKKFQEYRGQKEFLIVIFGGITFGFCIWAFFPFLTGHSKQWNVAPFYLLISIVGGGILGIWAPKRIATCYLSVWLGQVIALAVLSGLHRSWLGLEVIMTVIGSLLVLIGAFIGSIIRKLLQHIKRKESQ